MKRSCKGHIHPLRKKFPSTNTQPRTEKIHERTFSITPAIQIRAAELARAQFPVRRLGESFILVNLGQRLALLQQLLQAKQVSIDALPIGSPGSVLEVTSSSSAEEGR